MINKINYYTNIALSWLPLWFKRLWYFGHNKYCPVCDSSLRCFRSFGQPIRYNAWCSLCGSLERHRFAWMVLQKKTDLFDGKSKSLLHVAPEPIIEHRLRGIPDLNYLSGDLTNAHAMLKMDLTAIPMADASFDVFFCSHVLEHIPADRVAIAELYRVLKPGGWGVIQVPIHGKTTREDPTIEDPKERLRLFGQEDHFRIYGADLKERLSQAGFSPELISADQVASTEERKRFGIDMNTPLFLCFKDTMSGNQS